MQNCLQLRLEPDDDGTCELFAEVRQGQFSGAASAWFGLAEIQAFGQTLQDQFPLQPGNPITLEGGFWARSGPTKIEEVHLGIKVYPIGGLGLVGVKVMLATQVHGGVRSESQCSVTVELQSNCEPLRSFGQGIVAIAQRNSELATLLANDA